MSGDHFDNLAQLYKRKLVYELRCGGSSLLSDKAEYAVVKGSLVAMKHDFEPWYPACCSEKCGKKMVQVVRFGEKMWHCEKCNAQFDKVNVSNSL